MNPWTERSHPINLGILGYTNNSRNLVHLSGHNHLTTSLRLPLSPTILNNSPPLFTSLPLFLSLSSSLEPGCKTRKHPFNEHCGVKYFLKDLDEEKGKRKKKKEKEEVQKGGRKLKKPEERYEKWYEWQRRRVRKVRWYSRLEADSLIIKIGGRIVALIGRHFRAHPGRGSVVRF